MFDSNIKIWGRITKTDEKINLFWTGSCIEMNVTGSELYVEFYTDYSYFENWISILVNDSYIARQMLPKGNSKICIFRGMLADKVKNIKIIKDMQALNEDNESVLQVCNIHTDGEFRKVEDKPYKIEFIGDSITSGEGCFGAKDEEEWIPMWFSAVNSYTYMTSKKINAEYRVISQSGWGVTSSWDNNIYNTIPQYYEKVCGLLKGENNIKLGAHKMYDFKSWQPDFVVVNLGTNDASAFNSPAWFDEISKHTHKRDKNNKDDIESFKNDVVHFLKLIRKNNSSAHIMWVYGMLGYEVYDMLESAIEDYKKETCDNNVELLKLIETTDETVGSRQHPGKENHEIAAYMIAEAMKKSLK